MTGSSYRDWVSHPDYLMNGFAYTATVTGVGDYGTNIERGDSGGPMLIGTSTGYVIGDLSHWEPYGIATFGPGGPLQCSGLDVMRYAPEALHAEFGAPFQLLRHETEVHQTPAGKEQEFVFCYCRRV